MLTVNFFNTTIMIIKGNKSHSMLGMCIMLIVLGLSGFNQTADGQSSSYYYTSHLQGGEVQNVESLKSILEKVEESHNITFFYDDRLVDNKYVAVPEMKSDSLANFLGEVLSQKGLTYQNQTDRIYVIMPMPAPPAHKVRQQEAISGSVTDAQSGETLPGVNILVKGTTTGTSTDTDGNFELEVPSLQDTLVISFIGYQTQEVPINGRTEINVALQSQVFTGEDLVVVGYGTQEKANLTGSVGSIQSDMIENRPIANTAQGLQGAIPNLNVTVRTGDPHNDGDVTFNVRGYESISGGSPLVLIDGVPMDLQSINPNDIESITVLKDAAASAIYGARAAFGVILVTTKSASQTQSLNVTYGGSLALNTPIFKMDILDNSYDYAVERNKATIRGDGSPAFSDDFVEATRRYTEDPENNPEFAILPSGTIQYYGWTDHRAETIRKSSPQFKHDLSISGGSGNSSYYASFSHFNHQGMYKLGNDNFKRYNILLKTEFDVNDWLTLDENVTFNARLSDQPHIYHYDTSLNTLARVPSNVMDRFPLIEGLEEYAGMYFGGQTMLGYLDEGGRDLTKSTDIWLRSGVTLNPTEKVRIRGEYTYNTYNRNQEEQQTQVQFINNNAHEIGFNNGFTSSDYILNREDTNQYYKFEAYAEYTNDFAEHHVKGMVGFSQELYQYSWIQGQAFDVITPRLTNISSTLGSQQTDGGESELALRGAFYRLNYSYDDRYLFEFNGRYDGSSRFPKEDRFGFFPSLSLGWRLSHESFMQKTNAFLDELKLRVSYGTLGNQDVASYYPYISTMNVGLGNLIMSNGRIPMVSAAGLVSPTLTWESVTTKNAGIDIALFKNKLEANFDVYTRETKDMLMNTDYPNLLGTASPSVNAADLRTSGWELSLLWRDAINNDLSYSVTASLSDWQSEITKYEGNATSSLNDYYEGMKIGEIWGYEVVGIFQTEAEVANAPDQSQIAGGTWRPGDIQYKDLNGDGVISLGANTVADPGDRTVIGNSNPRYSFGFNLDVRYKNWAVNAFVQGVGKRDYWPAGGDNFWFWPYGANTMIEKWHVEESWSEDNSDALFHAPSIRSGRNLETHDRYLQNAAYARLKNLRIAYHFPTDLLSKAGLNTAQLYVSGQNLGEITNIHPPLDPETIFSGNVQYPHQRVYSIGVEVSF